jgi:cytochrome c biogenesis protein CcdA
VLSDGTYSMIGRPYDYSTNSNDFEKIGKQMNKDIISAKSKFAFVFGLFSLGIIFVNESISYNVSYIIFIFGVILIFVSIFLARYFINNL